MKAEAIAMKNFSLTSIKGSVVAAATVSYEEILGFGCNCIHKFDVWPNVNHPFHYRQVLHGKSTLKRVMKGM